MALRNRNRLVVSGPSTTGPCKPIARVSLGARVPEQMFFDGNSLWVALHYSNELIQVDPFCFCVVRRIKLSERWTGPEGVYANNDFVIVSGYGEQATGNTVHIISKKNYALKTIHIPEGPFGVWTDVSNRILVAHQSGYISSISNGGKPHSVAVGKMLMYVCAHNSKEVAYYTDYASNSVGIVSSASLQN